MIRINRALLPLLQLVAVVGGACLFAIAIVVVSLNPPGSDIELLVVYMLSSGLATVLVVYFLYQRQLFQRVVRLRWALLMLIGLTILLVFTNVWITARLMFISDHDLVLTTALLIFGGAVAAASAFFVANTLRARINELAVGVRALAEADWKTRLPAHGSDELAQFAALFNDMAARLQQIDAEKQALEEARRNLIAWVSHDLRTPLASMRAMNEAILDGVVTDAATVARYHANMRNEITHMSQLIDDLFALAQLDATNMPIQTQRVELRDLISDTLSRIAARAQAQNICLQVSVGERVDLVVIAPDKIQRVLYNLLENALSYTPAGGCISLDARRVRDQVEVSVHNTGSFIPTYDLAHIFDSFYRGEQSRRREEGKRGTGLGLAIVRGFVQAHGGTIRAESSVDSGTRFVFTLPAQN